MKNIWIGLLAILCVLIIGGSGWADTHHWNGDGDGSSWNDPDNWLEDAVPATTSDGESADDVEIDGNYTVNITANVDAIHYLTIDGDALLIVESGVTLGLQQIDIVDGGIELEDVGGVGATIDWSKANRGHLYIESDGYITGTGLIKTMTGSGSGVRIKSTRSTDFDMTGITLQLGYQAPLWVASSDLGRDSTSDWAASNFAIGRLFLSDYRYDHPVYEADGTTGGDTNALYCLELEFGNRYDMTEGAALDLQGTNLYVRDKVIWYDNTEATTAGSLTVATAEDGQDVTTSIWDDDTPQASAWLGIPPNVAPTADAGSDQTVTDTDSNGSESVTLDGTGSSDSDGTIASYVWEENSSQVATGSSPSVTLATGVHTITLTVTDDDSATDSDTVVITVNENPNQAPVVDAGSDATITMPANASLDAIVTDDGKPTPPAAVTYAWTKVSGPGIVTFADATAQDTLATFTTSGTYVLRLTADDSALTDSDDVTITVNAATGGAITSTTSWTNTSLTSVNGSFTAEFDAVPHYPNMDGVTGFSNVTVDEYNDLACIIRFNQSGNIDVRNGGIYASDVTTAYTVGTSYHVRMEIDITSHTYDVYVTPAGGSQITLADDYAFRTQQNTITNIDNWLLKNEWGSHTISNMTITLPNVAPTADAGTDQTVTDADDNGSESVTLDGSGSADSDGTITSYVWEENSSQIATGSGPSVSLTQGVHTITLTVTDDDGATDSDTVVITVNDPPAANAGADQVVTDADDNGSESVTLDGSGSTDSDGTIASYVWKEGQTQVATGVSPSVSFSVGTHTLTLEVTDNHGGTDTDTVAVKINVVPTADAGSDQTVTDSDDSGDEQVTLDGSSSSDADGSIASYVWKENTTQIATGSNPVVTLDVGSHTLTLEVTDDDGATDSDTVAITVSAYVNVAPTADAGADQYVTDADSSGSETVTLDGSGSSDSDGTITSYVWKENATQIATGATPSVSLAAGTHTIELTVTDDDTATDTDTVVVTVSAAGDFTLVSDPADQVVRGDGTFKWIGQAEMRVGGGIATYDSAAVLVFELPALPTGEEVVDANLDVYLQQIVSGVTGNVDLYGLDYRSASSVLTTDFYHGTYDGDTSTNVTALQNDLATTATSLGTVSSDSTGDSNLVDFIQAQYDAGAAAGDYIFLRLSIDVADESDYKYYAFSSGNHATSSQRPVLTFETDPVITNTAPTADAGSDITITLSSLANLDGTITDDGYPLNPGSTSATWTKVSGPGTVTFTSSSSVDTTADFSVAGTYVLQLEADDGELTDTDTITVTVDAAVASSHNWNGNGDGSSWNDSDNWVEDTVPTTTSDGESASNVVINGDYIVNITASVDAIHNLTIDGNAKLIVESGNTLGLQQIDIVDGGIELEDVSGTGATIDWSKANRGHLYVESDGYITGTGLIKTLTGSSTGVRIKSTRSADFDMTGITLQLAYQAPLWVSSADLGRDSTSDFAASNFTIGRLFLSDYRYDHAVYEADGTTGGDTNAVYCLELEFGNKYDMTEGASIDLQGTNLYVRDKVIWYDNTETTTASTLTVATAESGLDVTTSVWDDDTPQAAAYVGVSTGGGNLAPVADAGSDQTVTDTDDSGSESVTLDGTGSTDSDGTISSYVWTENSSQIATGSMPVVSLATGTHTITLTVTDDDSDTDTDTVVVTVNAYTNVAPTADAGPDQNVTDTDDNGSQAVTLDGTGSTDSDGTISSYVWKENASQIATGSSPSVTLNVGSHTIELTVTDDDSATDTDTVVVTVSEPSAGDPISLLPLTNRQSGISMSLSGTNGSDWAVEHHYHDMGVGDQVIYLKSSVDISLAHNANNVIMKTDTVNIDFVQGVSGGGVIHYKIDRDMQSHRYSSSGTIPTWAPAYTTSFDFDSLTYDGSLDVLGQTGDNNGSWGDSPRGSTTRFAYGQLDAAGNEWHTLTYWDDDEPIYTAAGESSHRQGASDGHWVYICVNPDTPIMQFNASGTDQYYTTPIKTYHVPKTWAQTTYLTGGVQIALINITNSETIYYRVDSGSWVAFGGTNNLVASDLFSTNGTHTLEVKNGTAGDVVSRTIVLNPSYPASSETHGYLLWANSTEKAAIAYKLANDQPFTTSYTTFKGSYYQSSGATYTDQRDGWRSGAGMASGSLANAFAATMDGVSSQASLAALAKTRLLRMARLEAVGFEDGVSNATPSKDYLNELGQTIQQFADAGVAYDLLASCYRQSDDSNGMTPIEEIFIRDGLAEIAKTILQFRANWSFTSGAGDTHWAHGYELAVGMIAAAMPTYKTPYYGVSGADESTINDLDDANDEYWNPFPDQGVTWWQCVTDPDISTPGHPNVKYPMRSEAQISDDGYWTGPNDLQGDGDRYVIGYNGSRIVDVKSGGLANAENRIELVEMSGYESPFSTRIQVLDYIRRLHSSGTQQTCVTNYINRRLVDGYIPLIWSDTLLRYTQDTPMAMGSLVAFNNHYESAGLQEAQDLVGGFLTDVNRYYGYETGTYPSHISSSRKELYSAYVLALCWDPDQITVNYSAANKKPIVKPAFKYVVEPGDTLHKEIIAMDPDGDSLTVSVSNLPSGASYTSSTQTISWTPGSGDTGVYIATLSANDGTVTTSRPFPIIVMNNPGVASPPSGPSNFTATLTTGNEVDLDWDAPSGVTVSNYVIYRDGSLHAVVPGTQTYYTDTDALPDGSHTRYHISLYDSDGHESTESAASPNIISVSSN